MLDITTTLVNKANKVFAFRAHRSVKQMYEKQTEINAVEGSTTKKTVTWGGSRRGFSDEMTTSYLNNKT